jgi:serine protease Do
LPKLLAPLLVAPVLAAVSATGLPRQELLRRVTPSVVHLSIRSARGSQYSSGSGFVISEDGRLATNHHVIAGAHRIVAVFADGKEVEITGVRAFDADADVAIVQLDRGHYPPLKIAAEPAKQGDDIAVMGSPAGLGPSLSEGIVSAVREHGTVTKWDKEGQESWGIQITATIAPGSSGSPIVNKDGEVVGLAVGRWGESLFFGVPIARLQRLLDQKDAGVVPLKPLEAAEGTNVRTNLLISAAVFGSLGLLWWLSVRQGRGRNRARRGGWR